jgi:DNA gyrase inhibitor GyrI
METTIKVLPEMKVVCFEAYSPDSETKAFDCMKAWIKDSNLSDLPYRVFGYNIDSLGNLSYDPQHAGYKVLVYADYSNIDLTYLKTEVIKPGKFLVTRTEGKIENVGQWLMDGWIRVNKTVQDEKLKVKNSPRWFEEHIRTQEPDYMQVDLYLEIE